MKKVTSRKGWLSICKPSRTQIHTTRRCIDIYVGNVL